MRSVTNKTQKPLGVPLPRGKILHLGPGRTGQISSNAVDHPQLRMLLDGGSIALSDEGSEPAGGSGGGGRGMSSFHGHPSTSGGRRSGDR